MSYTETAPSRSGWTTGRIVAVIGGAVVLLLLICGGCGIGSYSSNVSKGRADEAQLSAKYSNGANYLSACVTTTNQTANVAQAYADNLDRVIRDAIGQQANGGAPYTVSTGRSQLYPLMIQAYPTLSDAQFNAVMTNIINCQGDFAAKQGDVLDAVRSFNAWRTGFWVSMFTSFPDDNLYVAIPGVPRVTGDAALNKIETPIVAEQVSDAYRNGTFTPSNPFGTPTPTAPAVPTPPTPSASHK
ncbi:MAG TPA: hypothetical protein VLF91_06725 [Candidatus Saccharimonadales bacterium]|nr:hypothetical protein [Candidatus Saccharimonadales bacterium]